EFTGVEVYYGGNEQGWSVLVEVMLKEITTKETVNVDLVYETGIRKMNREPTVREFREGVKYIIRGFQNEYPEWEGLGVHLFFNKEKEQDMLERREKGKYEKIKGTKEDTEYFLERFSDMLDTGYGEILHREVDTIRVYEPIGLRMEFSSGVVLVFGEGGIMTDSGESVYLKREMNLQKGLRELAKYLGRSEVTLGLMRVYDYRRRVKE